MSSDKKTGTDPRKLRALAHPVRLDLLYLLQREGPLTASRAAELLGLTAKVCSYHLNQLGAYGVIEETGDGKGRSRPWQLALDEISYVHEPDEAPETTRAEDAFAKAMLSRDARVIDDFIDGRHRLPAQWRNVSTLSSNPLRLSAQQLRDLGRELTEVVERYRLASHEPASGAHPVHTALYAVPTDLAELTTEGAQ